jgi:hypothetical protein
MLVVSSIENPQENCVRVEPTGLQRYSSSLFTMFITERTSRAAFKRQLALPQWISVALRFIQQESNKRKRQIEETQTKPF